MLSGFRKEKLSKKDLQLRVSSNSYNMSCVADIFKGSGDWKALHVWSEGRGWQWQRVAVGWGLHVF